MVPKVKRAKTLDELLETVLEVAPHSDMFPDEETGEFVIYTNLRENEDGSLQNVRDEDEDDDYDDDDDNDQYFDEEEDDQ